MSEAEPLGLRPEEARVLRATVEFVRLHIRLDSEEGSEVQEVQSRILRDAHAVVRNPVLALHVVTGLAAVAAALARVAPGDDPEDVLDTVGAELIGPSSTDH